MPVNLRITPLLLVTIHCLLSRGARAQQRTTDIPLPTTRALPRAGPIVIDGRLADSAWLQAPVATGFSQSFPRPDLQPSEQSEVRVLVDDRAVYVAVRMFDSRPDLIAHQLGRRDQLGVFTDWVHVGISPNNDRKSGFRFSLSPRGVKRDALLSNDTQEDLNWDSVWQGDAHIDSLGWTAEFRIPFSQLRFAAAGSPAWGFQVQRDIARRSERHSWARWLPQMGRGVSLFGELTGVNAASPSLIGSVTPFASVQSHSGDGFAAGSSSRGTRILGGADVRVELPASAQVAVTLRPDFGQLEVDPAVVNLTTFESVFPEKRPFFLEAADALRLTTSGNAAGVRDQVFYSRRIGRSPVLAPSDSSRLISGASETSINAAIKLTRRTARSQLALLAASTRAASVALADSTGSGSLRLTAEPAANLLLARARRTWGGNATTTGVWVGSTFRGDANTLVARPDQSTVIGVDFDHAWARRTWTISGYMIGSRLQGSPRAIASVQRSSVHFFQRPDARSGVLDSSRTTLSGHGLGFTLRRSGTYFGSTTVRVLSPGYELNDVGLLDRASIRSASFELGYQNFKAGRVFHLYGVRLSGDRATNYDGNVILSRVAAEPFFSLNNLWSGQFSIALHQRASDDRLTRGGPLVAAPAKWQSTGNVTTDPRRRLSFRLSASGERDDAESSNWDAAVTADVRAFGTLRVRGGPSLSRHDRLDQYVTTVLSTTQGTIVSPRYVFATLRENTTAFIVRADWILSPRLSLQFFAQPLVARAAFGQFKELADAGSLTFARYPRASANAGSIQIDPNGTPDSSSFVILDPSFALASVRANAVVRWEWQDGASLYLVWQQNRIGRSPADFEPLLTDAFTPAATNTIAVKASFWIDVGGAFRRRK